MAQQWGDVSNLITPDRLRRIELRDETFNAVVAALTGESDGQENDNS